MGKEESMQTALELDAAFEKLREAIRAQAAHCRKEHRVRANVWLAKIGEQTNNLVWKRNRNQHARLLLEQLKAGVLEAPFDALPPGGGLPTLQPYLVYRFISPAGRSNSPPLRQSPLKVSRPHAGAHTQPTCNATSAAQAEETVASDAPDGGFEQQEQQQQQEDGHQPADCPQPQGLNNFESSSLRLCKTAGDHPGIRSATPERQKLVKSSSPLQGSRVTPKGAKEQVQPAEAAAIKCHGAAVITAGAGTAAGLKSSTSGGASAIRAAAKAHLDILINRFEQRRAQWELEAAKERAAAQSTGAPLPAQPMHSNDAFDDTDGIFATRQHLHTQLQADTASKAQQQQQQRWHISTELQGCDTICNDLLEADPRPVPGHEMKQTNLVQDKQPQPQQQAGLRFNQVHQMQPAKTGRKGSNGVVHSSMETGQVQCSPRSAVRPHYRSHHLQWLRQSADSVLYKNLTALMKELDQGGQRYGAAAEAIPAALNSAEHLRSPAALNTADAFSATPTSHFKVPPPYASTRETNHHSRSSSQKVSRSPTALRQGRASRSTTPPAQRCQSNIAPVTRMQNKGLSASMRLPSQPSFVRSHSKGADSRPPSVSPLSPTTHKGGALSEASLRHAFSQPGYAASSPGKDSFSFEPSPRARISTPEVGRTSSNGCTGMLDRLLGSRMSTDFGADLKVAGFSNLGLGEGWPQPTWVHTPATELVGQLSSRAAQNARGAGSQSPPSSPAQQGRAGLLQSLLLMPQVTTTTRDWVAGLNDHAGCCSRARSQPCSPCISPRSGQHTLRSQQLLTHQAYVQQQAQEVEAAWALQSVAAAAAIRESQQAVAAYSLALAQKQTLLTDLLYPAPSSANGHQLLSSVAFHKLEVGLSGCQGGLDAISTQLSHCLSAFHVDSCFGNSKTGNPDPHQGRRRSTSAELLSSQHNSMHQRGRSLDGQCGLQGSPSSLLKQPSFLQRLEAGHSARSRSASPQTARSQSYGAGALHQSPWRPNGPSRSPTPPRNRATGASNLLAAKAQHHKQSTDVGRQAAAIAALQDATAAFRQQVKSGVKTAQRLLCPLLVGDDSNHSQHGSPISLTDSLQQLTKASKSSRAAAVATELLEEVVTETVELVKELKQCAALLQEASSAGQVQASSSMDNVRHSLEAASLRHSLDPSTSQPVSPTHSLTGPYDTTTVHNLADPDTDIPSRDCSPPAAGLGMLSGKVLKIPCSSMISAQGQRTGRYLTPTQATCYPCDAAATSAHQAGAEQPSRSPFTSPLRSVTAVLLSDAESVLSGGTQGAAPASHRAVASACRAACANSPDASPAFQTRVQLFGTPARERSPMLAQTKSSRTPRPRSAISRGAVTRPESGQSKKVDAAVGSPAGSTASPAATRSRLASEVQKLLNEADALDTCNSKQHSYRQAAHTSSFVHDAPSPSACASVSVGRSVAEHMPAATRHARAVADEKDPLLVVAKRHEPLLPNSVLRALQADISTPPTGVGTSMKKHSSSPRQATAPGSSHITNTLLPPQLLREVLSIPEPMLMNSQSHASAIGLPSSASRAMPAVPAIAGRMSPAKPAQQLCSTATTKRCSPSRPPACSGHTGVRPSAGAVCTSYGVGASGTTPTAVTALGKGVTLLSPQMLADLRLDADLLQSSPDHTHVEQLISATRHLSPHSATPIGEHDKGVPDQRHHTTASVYARANAANQPDHATGFVSARASSCDLAAEASLADLAAASKAGPTTGPKPCPTALTAPKHKPHTSPSPASMPMRTVVEDLNAVYRRGVNSLRAAHSENMQNLEAFQSAKRAMGL